MSNHVRVEISWKELNEEIKSKLRLRGIDTRKEYTCHCQWEGTELVLVHIQLEGAPFTKEYQELGNRPSYLNKVKE